MKFSAQEEYGLRCLLRLAKSDKEDGMTIPEISKAENLSHANVAKLLRILRIGGIIESVRGQSGGYKLLSPPDEMYLSDILNVLGGRLYNEEFCEHYSGIDTICTNSIDCSIRSLWQVIQNVVDSVLEKTTLQDLLSSESKTEKQLKLVADEMLKKFEAFNVKQSASG